MKTGVWLTHWKYADGTPLCKQAEGIERCLAAPGEWLVRIPAEVTCPQCIEWMHA
jgi:hypothetical protein